MPGLIFPNVAENNMMDTLFGFATPDFKLFVNDHTPSASTVIANLTECSDMGYTSKTVGFGGSSTVSGKATVTGSTSGVNWSFGYDEMRTPFTVYGYWIEKSGQLYGVERFETPVYIDTAGGTVYLPGGSSSTPTSITVRLFDNAS